MKAIELAYFTLLVMAQYFFTSEALSWKTVPAGPINIMLGSNLTLVWDYTLDDGETTEGFFQVIWSRLESSGWNNVAVKSSMSGISVLRDHDYIKVDPDANATFIILKVRETDHTTFRCSIESKMSLTPTTVDLNVLVPSKVTWISDNKSFIEGNSVTLACKVKGNPVPYVSWISPNGSILQNMTNSGNNTYTIPHMHGWHVGAYRCMVQNVHGVDDRITYIYLPPKISTVNPKSKTVNESDTVSIFCNATGLPQPSVAWTVLGKKDEVLSKEETLTIPNIRRNQTGVYICTASNGVLGSASANSSINVQFPPSIIYTSPSRSITENETFTLFCNATGNPSPPIQWYKVNSTKGMFPVGNLLSIARIKEDDKGTYKCVADNGIGLPAVTYVEINVLVSPTIDVIFPKTQTVIESTSARIFCNATGNPEPNITWTKNEDSSLIFPNGKTLILSKINRNDTGTYRCTADNGVIKVAQEVATLLVHYPPFIARAPKDQFLNESNPLTLFCNATGNPPPNITWDKVGGSKRIFEGREMLYINKTSKMDEGTYRCTADNGIGSAVNATAYVSIDVFFAPVFSHTQPNVTTNESSSVVLQCNATGNPSPTIRWSYISHGLSTVLSDGNTLNLHNMQRNESGTYQCIASNGVGNPAVSDAFVNVHFAPDIYNHSDNQVITEGHQFLLYCNATGLPTPTITWLFKNSHLSEITIRLNTSILLVKNATREDDGAYICQAANGIGFTATVTVNVSVQYKPEMQAPLKRSISSWKGQQVELTCEANGSPVPAITWSRPGVVDNTAVNERTARSTLTVALSSSSLFGDYTCHAQNSVGSIASEINVIELVAPGSPFIHRVVPGNNTITITWNKPASDGGTPVTSYVAEVKREDDDNWATCTTQGDLYCSISGVKIAKSYNVRVTAKNIVGKGLTAEVKVFVTEHDIRLLDKRWSSVLYSVTSVNFTRLSIAFQSQVWKSYSNTTDIKGVEVINFRPGSVIAKFRIARMANTTNYLERLKKELEDGYLGSMRAELYFDKPGTMGARSSVPDDVIGGISSFIILLIIIFIILFIWYRYRRTKKVTLTKPKEEVDVESVQNGGEGNEEEDNSGKNDSMTNEDEGIEMDILSEDTDDKISRLSVTSGINSPRPPRPHTPLTKNRVHPATPEIQLQDDNSRREGVYTTQPATGIPTEYAHVLERSGTRDRLYAELAWLEKRGRPKRRTRLPSIAGSSAIQHRKYSILEILQSQQQVEMAQSKEVHENDTEGDKEN